MFGMTEVERAMFAQNPSPPLKEMRAVVLDPAARVREPPLLELLKSPMAGNTFSGDDFVA